MKARQPPVASFEELLATRYGRPERRLLREPDAVEELFANYYGKLPECRKSKDGASSVTLSLECDDGKKMLAQHKKPFEAGDAWSPMLKPAAPDGSHPRIGPLVMPEAGTYQGTGIPEVKDSQVEILPAAHETPSPPRKGRGREAVPAPFAADDSGASSVAASVVQVDEVDGSAITASEDDFLADMQAISGGQSVYDPVRQKTVPKTDLKEYPRDLESPDDGNGRGAAASDSNAIFERIAKSMQHAGAYDLGTVELENRFSDFDRMGELQQKATAEKKSKPKPALTPSSPTEDTKILHSEFIEDLDAIQKQAAAVAGALKPQVARETSVPTMYSEPLYDTGEHVLAGEDLYRDQLLVGKAPGVLFSYGQIIAMADLFGTEYEMMGEDAALLQNLKNLIEQSTAYYRGKKALPLKDVPNEAWDKATGGRYLKLAEDNYDHFAPNFLFKNQQLVRSANKNHKLAWEQHHERAIKEAQRMALDPAFANQSYLPSWPLIINAFGDHFLTDAFSAGHVINKEVVIEYFKTMFYSGSSLKPEGNRFFNKVAEKAWHGEVARKFKKLETAEPHDAWWNNLLGWLPFTDGVNPDIKNAERFAEVLKGAAEQAREKVANIAVKAIHDALNRDGIDVVNGAGSPPWKLTGDGYLTPTTLAIMRQAVAQSASNITDPSILGSNIAFANYFAKVWAYVPQLPASSEAKVKGLITAFVNPSSAQLVDTFAKIIHNEVNSLIKLLIEKKALQPL